MKQAPYTPYKSDLPITMEDSYMDDIAGAFRDCLAITALIAGIVVVTLAYWGVLG